MAAARLANCEEFVEKLPDKWNSNIGENGSSLSGGERQRISIARAFLKDAPIILLDVNCSKDFDVYSVYCVRKMRRERTVYTEDIKIMYSVGVFGYLVVS